ncbi:MAG: hypothetical protein RLZZ233_6 [Verrucomicrobiota bacterium]|jgi:hypothetical protein
MILRLIATLCASVCLAADIPSSGLLVDLDAAKGVTLDAQGRVTAWTNQVGGATTTALFVGQPKGRAEPTSGLPTVVSGERASLSFRQQELVCHDESAFDGLIRGSGCTWVAVIKVYPQRVGLKDVNSFFGNLRNGQKYEGLWGCLDDDNTVWWGARNGITFGRFDVNNPKLVGPKLEEGRFHFLAGRMGAGQPQRDSLADDLNVGRTEATLEFFVNDLKPCATARFPVNPKADASKLAIGQERDAIQHPGKESFDGEIARFLLWDRPLTDAEMKAVFERVK